MSPQVLLLPGWQNSGPDHWQHHWQQAHGYRRVEQHDWERPLRGDWLAQLENAVLATDPEQDIVLVAHSLGCLLVTAWALHSSNWQRVKGALLVAPPDLARDDLRDSFQSWLPIDELPLPFPNTLVYSTNDPYCSVPRTWEYASAWHSHLVNVGDAGHVNAESKLGDWAEGHDLLSALLKG